MIKAILFDVDGVVLIGRKKRFSERLAEEKGISQEKISEFFDNSFRDCSFGRADLKEVLAPYLKKWEYDGSVDDFLQFWFESESMKDEELLKIINILRSRGIKCYLATRQEKYRMSYILNNIGLKNYFDGTFVTYEIGWDKKHKEYWDYVLDKIKLKPEEIIFFDDTESNVELARKVGIKAYFYDGFEGFKEKFKDFN